MSRRLSIRWMPDPPSEPTSTLVLTSPAEYYVDVRFLIEGENGPLSSKPIVQWAFAGTCTHEIVDGLTVGAWIHEIDSQVEKVYQDSGHFTDMANGDSLETGRMKDEYGVERDYEEVWRDQSVEHADCCVLQMKNQRSVGYFIQIGEHAQGMIRTKEGGISVIRWNAGGGLWRVVAQSGTQVDWFPVPEALAPLQTGAVVIASGHSWNVVERLDHTTCRVDDEDGSQSLAPEH